MRDRSPLYGPRLSRLNLTVFILVLAAILFAPTARAGLLHERVVEQINKTPAGGSVSVLVTLTEQLDFAELEAVMARQGITTRAARHEFVIRAAQNLAKASQPALVAALNLETAAGRVRSFQPFWINNMIAVEADPQVLLGLSLRRDTGMIYPNDTVSLRLGEDDSFEPPPGGPRTLEDNLVAVNAQAAWDLGYTGAGRLVCSFDTGADGDHPAFASRWRGLDPGVNWWEAWKDPYNNTQFPYDSRTHGTHVLGLMAGKIPGGDPIGVAFNAKWIAAGILIGYNIQRIIECYEWAADPDGNPATIEDVPDVVNNSWGTSGDCDQTYWNAIDVIEAAGVVNTIAVDNSGPSPGSVNSPESRATTIYSNFGVGNVDPHTPGYPINPGSARGPSPCDSVSIKPEMTAPGTNIYSSVPDGYGYKSGTSMACPHVSGAVAILRQVNPDLTVEQIKDALMHSAFDRGVEGEDNDYGWGILDVGAAVESVLVWHPVTPPPQNLVAYALNDSVHLEWAAPSGTVESNPVVGYNIYRGDGENPFPVEPLASVDSGTVNFGDVLPLPGTYRYAVTALYVNGVESQRSNEAPVVMADPADAASRPGGDGLVVDTWPNPFRERVDFRLTMKEAGPVRIEIFDASGQRVRILADEASAPAGDRAFAWNGLDGAGRPLAAGAYFVRARTSAGLTQTRLVLLH